MSSMPLRPTLTFCIKPLEMSLTARRQSLGSCGGPRGPSLAVLPVVTARCQHMLMTLFWFNSSSSASSHRLPRGISGYETIFRQTCGAHTHQERTLLSRPHRACLTTSQSIWMKAAATTSFPQCGTHKVARFVRTPSPWHNSRFLQLVLLFGFESFYFPVLSRGTCSTCLWLLGSANLKYG